MSQQNPIRLFVAHAWEDSEDYPRIFEYLESARNFYYRNTSTPDVKPPPDQEGQREDLRRQIGIAEILIAPASLYRAHNPAAASAILVSSGTTTHIPVKAVT